MALPDPVIETCKFNSISTFLLRLKSDGTKLKAVLHFFNANADFRYPSASVLAFALSVRYVKLEDSESNNAVHNT